MYSQNAVYTAVSVTFESMGFIELEPTTNTPDYQKMAWAKIELETPPNIEIFLGMEISLINEISEVLLGIDMPLADEISDIMNENHQNREIFNDCLLEFMNTISGNIMRNMLRSPQTFMLKLPSLLQSPPEFRKQFHSFHFTGDSGSCTIFITGIALA